MRNGDRVEQSHLLGTSRPSFIERIYTPKMCVVMFTLINLFTYFDRGSISATLSSIRSDSSIAGSDGVISETKGGLIVSVFMVGYMVACPIFAALGKWVSVRILVATGLAIWCAACVMTGVAQSYPMLIVTRMMVGVGEASFSGYFVTILDNIAPKSQRTMWIGIFYSMIPTGTALGMACAGVISSMELHGIAGWRLVFFLEIMVSAPFCVLCCMYPSKYAPTTIGTEEAAGGESSGNGRVGPRDSSISETQSLRTTTSPVESKLNSINNGDGVSPNTIAGDAAVGADASAAADAAVAAAMTSQTAGSHDNQGAVDKSYADPLTAMLHLLTNIDYILICFGYGMYVFVTCALAVWAISMLTTGPWHMSDVGASSVIGAAVAFTGLAGSIAGGLFVDKMGGSQGALGVWKCLTFNSASMAIALPFGIAAMFVYHVGGFIVLFICGVFFVFTITAPVNASILSSVRHDVRTYAMSFSTMFIHLVGDFPSPTVSGAIADSFDDGCSDWKDQYGCRNATATNNCYWVEPKKNSNGHCVNEFETRNAMVIVFSFIAISIPVWMIAAFRARSRAKHEGYYTAVDVTEGDVVNPQASSVAIRPEA